MQAGAQTAHLQLDRFALLLAAQMLKGLVTRPSVCCEAMLLAGTSLVHAKVSGAKHTWQIAAHACLPLNIIVQAITAHNQLPAVDTHHAVYN